MMEVNDTAYEQGYDSDGEMVPFYDVVVEERGVGFYEEPMRPVDDVSSDNMNASSAPNISNEDNDAPAVANTNSNDNGKWW